MSIATHVELRMCNLDMCCIKTCQFSATHGTLAWCNKGAVPLGKFQTMQAAGGMDRVWRVCSLKRQGSVKRKDGEESAELQAIKPGKQLEKSFIYSQKGFYPKQVQYWYQLTLSLLGRRVFTTQLHWFWRCPGHKELEMKQLATELHFSLHLQMMKVKLTGGVGSKTDERWLTYRFTTYLPQMHPTS